MSSTEGTFKIGSFTSKRGHLCVFDPYCQGIDVELTSCRRGTWDAYVTKKSQDAWGIRPTHLTVVAEGINPETLSFSEDVGNVMVDAATVGIYDLADVRCTDDMRDNDGYIPRLCEYGASSLSGFGDGCYGVFAARGDDGMVCGVQVVFIPDDDDIRFITQKETEREYDSEDY